LNFEKFTSSKFFEFCESLYIIFIVNLLTIFISVFTLGIAMLPALVAAFYCLKEVKNPQLKIMRYYFQKFRDNFQASCFLNIVMLMIAALIGLSLWFYIENNANWLENVGFYAMAFFALLYVLIYIYLPLSFIYLADMNSPQKVVFSFYFALSNILNTLLLLIILIGVILLLIYALPIFLIIGVGGYCFIVLKVSELKMNKHQLIYEEFNKGEENE